jgi:aminopeptidase N
VAYGNGYRDSYGFTNWDTEIGHKFDYIIIHESAHEWWGNSITTNDLADMWIHEGFATYAEALYLEYLYGHDVYLSYINSEKRSVQNDAPIIADYNVNAEGSEDMYFKGALLIHTIRTIINNDKKFFEILRGIQDKFKYQTVNSKDIEQYISDRSGIDFSEIFDRYLHYKSIPELTIVYTTIGDDLKITFQFNVPENSNFTMPVKMTVKKDKYDFVLVSGKVQSLLLMKMKAEDFKVSTDLLYIDAKIIAGYDPSKPKPVYHTDQIQKQTK